VSFVPGLIYSQEKQNSQAGGEGEAVGEMFGIPVSMGNYYFAKRTLSVFGAKWSADPKTPAEVEDLVWQNLLLSYEAFKRGIEVSPQELDEEITKTLKGDKAPFNWKENNAEYEKWLKERINENGELFANQLKYLLQIQKLRQQVMDGINPSVTEEEAYQEFLNEYNTLELELAQFDDLKSAEEFYKKAKGSSKFWDRQKKDNPKIFRQPGFVALEFLRDMWQLPHNDLYKMLELKAGSIYPVIPIYSGKYASVRVLKIRKADKAEFAKLRQQYYERVKAKKKYDGLNDWLKKIKEDAQIKVYEKSAAVSPAAQGNAKKEEKKQ